MNKRVILEKKEEYIGVVRSLKRLRPACHAVSAISTICFCVVWITGFQFAQNFITNNYILSYIIASSVSIAGALYFERIVSGVIDAFATIFVDGHGWKPIIGIALVLIPVFFVAASTSFVGFKNTIAGDAATESAKFLSEFAGSLNDKNQKSLTLMQSDEISFRKSRKSTRKAIIQKWNAKIKSAKIECKNIYREYKTNAWHKSKLKECQLVKDSEFNAMMAEELLNFDNQTEFQIKNISSSNDSIGKSALDANGNVLNTITDLKKQSVNRVNWLGGFFGFAAIVALFVSLFAAIIEKSISNVLVKKLNSHSPTTSIGRQSGFKRADKPKNVRIPFGGGGEKGIHDEFEDVKRLNILRLNTNNPNAYDDTVKMHEAIESINKKGYGVYFSRDETVVTLKKIDHE